MQTRTRMGPSMPAFQKLRTMIARENGCVDEQYTKCVVVSYKALTLRQLPEVAATAMRLHNLWFD
jgi:hypothetical protein